MSFGTLPLFGIVYQRSIGLRPHISPVVLYTY